MSRKSIILCLSILAVLLLGLGAAIGVLYADVDSKGSRAHASSSEGVRACMSAIPSDAVMVSFFGDAGSACRTLLSSFALPAIISDMIEDGTLASLKKSSMAVSLHYAGKLHGLYILEVAKATDESVAALGDLASKYGLKYSKSGDYFVMSKSETLVRSSVRHMEKNVSVADSPGFKDAQASVEGKDVLLVSNLHAQKYMPSLFVGSLARKHQFVERLSEWMAFDISTGGSSALSLKGTVIYDGDVDEFMTVFGDCTPGVSEMGKVLPDYTLSAVSLPMKNLDEYISAYQEFIDSRQGLPAFKARQKDLGSRYGLMPEDFFRLIGVREVGQAVIPVKSAEEKVNLIRTESKDVALIFKGNDVTSLRNYVPSVHSWAYPSYLASVFGNFFNLTDESCFTYVDGWVISGSHDAVDEFVSNKALDYTLEEYVADAGKSSLFSSDASLLQVYVALKKSGRLSSFLKPEVLKPLSALTCDNDCAPAVFCLTRDKEDIMVSFDIYALNMKRTKAPSQERDTVVVVPSGPFKVKNSHTGKMNTFYQNQQKAICLKDENGKDLWGVPFDKTLCGRAYNVDYYANGKLQIIFGAGSSIYVIDRLGRYVTGFPLDLGNEIILGPDVYDFAGARKYNIMVLHKDNTIQMYNLKGQKPQAWKGIATGEKIKALPERLTIQGKDFWIVRTSLQTLIFPFYGGEPLTMFDGDGMIRPDSEVKPLDGTSVEVTCYDGKQKTIRIIK